MSVEHLRVVQGALSILCLCVSASLSSKVVWKNTGESITFQCRCKPQEAHSMSLRKGLSKDTDIFFVSKTSKTPTFQYPERSQHHGDLPDVDILLKNVSREDTGVYWCMCHTYNPMTAVFGDAEGNGSVLLIVTDPSAEADKSTAADQSCNSSNQDLVVTSVVISSAVLFSIFIVLLLLAIRKVKYLRIENKPRAAPLNEVYEDMRGTIRR